MKLLDIAALQASFAAGDVASVALHAVQGTFEVRWTTRNGTARLAEEGGAHGRHFPDPGEALLLLKTLGIHSVQVDTKAWQPEPESVYEDWLKAKVASSLAGLQDGTNKVYSADEWAAIRAARGWDGKTV